MWKVTVQLLVQCVGSVSVSVCMRPTSTHVTEFLVVTFEYPCRNCCSAGFPLNVFYYVTLKRPFLVWCTALAPMWQLKRRQFQFLTFLSLCHLRLGLKAACMYVCMCVCVCMYVCMYVCSGAVWMCEMMFSVHVCTAHTHE
jgi:hypothetical protein